MYSTPATRYVFMSRFVTKPSYVNYETMNQIYAHGFRGVCEVTGYGEA